jgi:hypothetical protein
MLSLLLLSLLLLLLRPILLLVLLLLLLLLLLLPPLLPSGISLLLTQAAGPLAAGASAAGLAIGSLGHILLSCSKSAVLLAPRGS